jgi:DNA adenine methylase
LEETDMKINALVPWFGGKRTLAPLIVRELGPHRQYFEPFCGSMAVLLAKPHCANEVVNDLHGDLINLARVVACEPAAIQLYRRLVRAPLSEGLLHEAATNLADTTSLSLVSEPSAPTDPRTVDRAYWYFLASWMGRNGLAGLSRLEYQIAVRWTDNGGSPTVRWRNAVESIPAWHRRLLYVTILQRDAFQILDRFDDVPDTAIYVDSPYHEEARGGMGSASGRYLHDFEHRTSLFGPDDHTRLRDALAAYSQARIVVSHYDCPAVQALYQGWTIVPCHRQKHLHAQGGRGGRKSEAPEVLIINGPSYTAHDGGA